MGRGRGGEESRSSSTEKEREGGRVQCAAGGALKGRASPSPPCVSVRGKGALKGRADLGGEGPGLRAGGGGGGDERREDQLLDQRPVLRDQRDGV